MNKELHFSGKINFHLIREHPNDDGNISNNQTKTQLKTKQKQQQQKPLNNLLIILDAVKTQNYFLDKTLSLCL